MVTVFAVPLLGLTGFVDRLQHDPSPLRLGAYAAMFVLGSCTAALFYRHHDDDNWFTDAGKRLKRRIESLAPKGLAPGAA